MAKFSGRIPELLIINDVFSHMDWLPTILSYAGDPDIKQQLLEGHTANGMAVKVHLDGYDMTELLAGENVENPRKYYVYSTDGRQVSAIPFDDRLKTMYLVQGVEGTEVWLREIALVESAADVGPADGSVRKGW